MKHGAGTRRSADPAEDLLLKRERQFKVMAEGAHRQAQKHKRLPGAGKKAPPFKAGAAGWSQAREHDAEPAVGQTGSLF